MSKRKNIITDSDDESDFEFPDLSHCDKKIKTEFFRIKKEVEKSEPNIIEILKNPITTEDKIELFQLFEIYTNSEDLTTSKYDLKKEINRKFSQAIAKYQEYEKLQTETKVKIESQLKHLHNDNEHDLKYKILSLNCSEDNKKTIYNEYIRMSQLNFGDDELPKLKNWLNQAISLPHDNIKTINYNKNQLTKLLQTVSNKLDDELYGMHKVKEQILIFLNSRLLNPSMQKCSIGLLGPPGCGKTTIVKLLSQILDYPLQQISLGGIQSPSFLKGHQYTYIGAEPGEIVKSLQRMGIKNGILFFDEYDKISDNKDVCSALLHITDSTQNKTFRDNFLAGIDIDLSHLWFFYSMNSKPNDLALSDRIFYIELEGYDQKDKFNIVKHYLIKKYTKNISFKPDSISISDDAINYIIEKTSPPSDKGIRQLENTIISIFNKINFLYNHQDKKGKLNFKNISFNLDVKLTLPFNIDMNVLNYFEV